MFYLHHCLLATPRRLLNIKKKHQFIVMDTVYITRSNHVFAGTHAKVKIDRKKWKDLQKTNT